MADLKNKTFGVTTTINLGNYQNVKVLISRTDDREEFESIRDDVLNAIVTHVPVVVSKVKEILDEMSYGG